ncbi:FixH family protein [Calditrichota bacterium]
MTKTKKKNYWAAGIIAVLVLFVLVKLVLIMFSTLNKSDLVTADYYEAGLTHQNRIEAEQNAAELSEKLLVSYRGEKMEVALKFPVSVNDSMKSIPSGVIVLYRPSHARSDRIFEISTDSSGIQVVPVDKFGKGLWRVKVSWTQEGKEFFSEEKIIIE